MRSCARPITSCWLRVSGALDVSSNWAKFPRYGYIANYDAETPAVEWIRELNRYHINGLLFYDVQI